MNYSLDTYDRTDPMSIFNYSRHLIGNSLHSLPGDDVIERSRKGKGGLGQMVEECFFRYDVNSNREADFAEAHVEVKCTPLLKSASGEGYRVKERLVCTMIDYFTIVNTSFEDSHFLDKCRLMLLLFYLHVSGNSSYDFEFLFRVLWQLPEKDLLLIKQDYQTIADKIRPEAFWSIGDRKNFHVRPKARRKSDLTQNPNGGMCEKYCYWFNADYVKRIIDSNKKR